MESGSAAAAAAAFLQLVVPFGVEASRGGRERREGWRLDAAPSPGCLTAAVIVCSGDNMVDF